MFGSSVSRITLVEEYQIGQYSPELRELMVELNSKWAENNHNYHNIESWISHRPLLEWTKN